MKTILLFYAYGYNFIKEMYYILSNRNDGYQS